METETRNSDVIHNCLKPPIGIIPKQLHDEKRFNELKKVILEYLQSNFIIPHDWIVEYNDYLKIQ